ncbi:dihydrolipoamide acetyltransferase family protein [Polaromonas sp.]|uniref:dihydrolipoamide acetyltransferase family protein n=1 Tax=Polaromonas sp. TaxID=1869339 RepID=UPI0032676506
MGLHIIKVPDIGEGTAEVELAAWHVKAGDLVTEDQALADIMTDKATVEIPSPVMGRIVTLGGQVGQQMAVGAELVRIEVDAKGNVADEAVAVPGDAAAPVVARIPQAAPGMQPQPPSQPEPQAQPRAEPTGKPLASPSVRRRADELGVGLKYVQGSGPAGRVMHEDLDLHVAARGAAVSAPSPGRARLTGETQIQVVGLRRKIAQKMQESKRRVPHFGYVEEVDVTKLETMRGELNARYSATRGKLTLLSLLARALVIALREFPQINARYDDDAGVVKRYEAVHLGIATQTSGGLMVPVLRHAESHDLWSCAAEIAGMAERARSGKSLREELSGSTLTISSLGVLGGIVTAPVINYPEVAIVGVNRIVERPVFRGGAVVSRQMMNLSSSFDHRVVDGVDAAGFIQAVRLALESPSILLIE